MDDPGARAAVKRLLQAFEMAESGIAMMRQTLRRRFPADDEGEIGRKLVASRAARDLELDRALAEA